MQGGIPPSIPDSHTYRITITKCCINTVVFPDDGHDVSQNMQKLINILRNKHTKKNSAPSWLYVQDPPKDYLSTKICGIICPKMNLDIPFFFLIDDN
jgi:hypothetical protein